MKGGSKAKIAAKAGGGYKGHVVAACLLFAAVFLSYSNSINGTWALDDTSIRKPAEITDIFAAIGNRKIAYLTFALNQTLAPFSAASFRVFNIFLHFLNSILLYILVYITVMALEMREQSLPKKGKGGKPPTTAPKEKIAFYAASVSALIFSLHPMNVNAVAYIIQRMASLATFFVLLALLSYIGASRAEGKIKSISLHILSLFLVFLGILSKENAVMAIPLLFLYDYFFISKFQGRIFGKKLLIAGAGLLGIGLGALALGLHRTAIEMVKVFLHPTLALAGGGSKNWMAVDVYWTPLQHVLTECRVICRYLFLVLLPLPRFLVFDWWGFPVSTGIAQPATTLLSMLLLASLLVFSIGKRRSFPLLSFGILWYLISISLESFLMVGLDLYFEHRNYLPLTGLIAGIVGQTVVSLGPKVEKRAVLAGALLLCAALGGMTYSRNFVWRDSITLWTDTLNKTPENLRAMMSLGNSYMKKSDAANAEKYFMEVVRGSSEHRGPHFFNDAAFSLGMLYLFRGDFEKAKVLTDKYDTIVSSYRPKILRGYYKALHKDPDGALKDYNQVLPETEGLDTVIVYTLTGDAFRDKGMWDAAIAQYGRAIGSDSGFSGAYYGMAVSYMAKRDPTAGFDYLSKALQLDPENCLALADMADLLLVRGSDRESAFAYARRAVAQAPFFYQPYLTMANVLTVLGRENDAARYYEEALSHNMPGYMVPFSKARACYMRGDRERAASYLAELRKYGNLPENMKNLLKL